jgi:putative addiction module killer protein
MEAWWRFGKRQLIRIGLVPCATGKHGFPTDIRIRRLSVGNPGDVKPVGKGVSELRIDYGPGYRVYFVQRGDTVVVLLAGGNKRTQNQDIQTALALAEEL